MLYIGTAAGVARKNTATDDFNQVSQRRLNEQKGKLLEDICCSGGFRKYARFTGRKIKKF